MFKSTVKNVILFFLVLGLALVTGCSEPEEKKQLPPKVSKKIAAPKKPAPKSVVAVNKKEKKAKAPATAKTVLSEKKKERLSIQKKKKPKKAEYRYNPGRKIDPFQPLFEKEKSLASPKAKSKIKRRKPQTPLEKIDLSQLKLVAILMAPSGNKALVEQANGRGYIIREGIYIGLNSGRVSAIEKDKVVIDEQVLDVYGNPVSRKKELKLRKKTGDL